jgi:hypothetical protein
MTIMAGPDALGQALPAAEASPISTGFSLPSTLGSLQYAISASESLTYGYYGSSGTAAATNLTGDIAYLSNSKLHPFSMVFSAGHAFSESSDEPSYNFLNLGVSQVANVGRWNLTVSDSVSYLPGTAAAGLSGVPGVGDLGVNPVQVTEDTGQGVLNNYSNRVANTAAGSISRSLTGKTSISGSGSYSLTRYLSTTINGQGQSSAGLDSDVESGSGGINHQIDARNTVGGNYSYSSFNFSGNNFGVASPGFSSQTASGSYTHQFTRKLSMNVAAGPQWTTVSNSGEGAALSVFADAGVAYAGKSFRSSLSFVRNTNSGYGSIAGAESNAIALGLNRTFAQVWNCSASATYTRTSSLPVAGISPYSADTYVEGVQLARAIARSLSGFASYTLERQTYSAVSSINVFSGTSQVVGFGITYSPGSLHLGRP